MNSLGSTEGGAHAPVSGSAPAAEVSQKREQSRHHDHEADDGGEEDGQGQRNRRLPADASLVRGGEVVAHEDLVELESRRQKQSDRALPRTLRVVDEVLTPASVSRPTARARA